MEKNGASIDNSVSVVRTTTSTTTTAPQTKSLAPAAGDFHSSSSDLKAAFMPEKHDDNVVVADVDNASNDDNTRTCHGKDCSDSSIAIGADKVDKGETDAGCNDGSSGVHDNCDNADDNANNNNNNIVVDGDSRDDIGCVHYKRRTKFVTPCCGKFYKCRYCHDENEDHHFDRKTLTELICTKCDTRQKVQAECENCGVRFGKYTCLICNLFDDEDKNQYHCDGCGICRIGGRNNFFHCEVCNMCLPLQLKTNGHRCVENISRSNCPVCLGDIHTSRYPCHIPDCGHLLHKTCFDQLLASGHYVCPTCQTSMIDMKKMWDYLDTQTMNIPVPKSHENSIVNIFCNDCFKQSTVKFHFIGLKCAYCGGYNTTKNIKTRNFSFPSSKDNPSTSA